MRPVVVALMATVLAIAGAAMGAPTSTSPVGLWFAVNRQTGEPRVAIRIFENNGKLFGRIEKIFNPADAAKTCVDCPGDRRDKPVVGLEILWGLLPDGNLEWSGGTVLDPRNGAVYDATLRLIDGGQKLVLRGYLFFRFLGGSETLIRDTK
jgi:uncharacterized protein (DUF2147 family)